MTTVPAPPSERAGLIRQLGIDTAYTIVGLPLAVSGFAVAIAGLTAGLGTLLVIIGVPVLAGTVLAARIFADLERLRLPAVLRRPARRPDYRVSEPGTGLWRRIINPLKQTQSWLDLLHCIVRFPIALLAFCIVVTWWVAAVGGTLTILWDWSLPRGPDDRSLAQLIGMGDSGFARIGLQTAIGLACLITLPAVVRGCALMGAGLSRALLISLAEMRQTISALTDQKAAAASAEAAALRKLERDIHDGPQQGLVRLAMDLGRARQQVGTESEALGQMLDEAIDRTRETLNELRALSRGIAPPVLTDRGLPSALVALAGRCTVPVALDTDFRATDGRLAAAVETTAYFSVAEALTNVAKHSGAAHCWVAVTETPGRLRIRIKDDGVGGAHLAKGHGLAGLADRVRATGGTLSVVSPVGGPTEIGVELPC